MGFFSSFGILPRMKKPVQRPKVYSVAELERLFKQPQLSRRHRALLMTTYAAGLRVSEVCGLKPADIISSRMQIRVMGKGRKERYTILSAKLLEELRAYWRAYRPSTWLFPTKLDPTKPITTRTAPGFSKRASVAGITPATNPRQPAWAITPRRLTR